MQSRTTNNKVPANTDRLLVYDARNMHKAAAIFYQASVNNDKGDFIFAEHRRSKAGTRKKLALHERSASAPCPTQFRPPQSNTSSRGR